MAHQRAWNAWLPTEIVSSITDEEPKRFALLVQRYVAEAAGAEASSQPDRWHALVKWMPLIGRWVRDRLRVTRILQVIMHLWVSHHVQVELPHLFSANNPRWDIPMGALHFGLHTAQVAHYRVHYDSITTFACICIILSLSNLK